MKVQEVHGYDKNNGGDTQLTEVWETSVNTGLLNF